MNSKPVVALLTTKIDMRPLAEMFRANAPHVEIRLGDESALGNLDEIDAVACWAQPHGLLARMKRLKLVQSVGAGVDHILVDPELPQHVPLCRVIDEDLIAGMVSYVCWAVVHQQRKMWKHLHSQSLKTWAQTPYESPRYYTVGFIGSGVLGKACAETLAAIGYKVRVWSTSQKPDIPPAIQQFTGDEERAAFLGECNAVVSLLPLTPRTHGIINREFIAQMPPGSHLINVGRGEHVVIDDVLAALDAGHLDHATLDNLPVEPLPPESVLWGHPRVTVTPHIATRATHEVVMNQLLRNLQAIEAGQPPLGLVKPSVGY